MDETSTDAKTEAVSSTPQGDTATPPVAQPAVTPDVKEPTLAEVAQSAFDAGVKKEAESSPEETAPESDVQTLNTTEEGKTPPDEKKEEPLVEEKDDKSKPPPFHEHPRWKEMVTERDTVRAELDAVKPLAESQKSIVSYCQQNQITPKEFSEALELVALRKSDPIKFYETVRAGLEGMAPQVGDKLSPDLQKAVDDGEMTLEWAKRVAQAEAKTKLAGRGAQLTQEQILVQRQEQFRQQVVNAANSWDSSHQANDPDFKPGSPKYGIVFDRYARLINEKDVKSPQDAVALLEEAYTYASTLLGQVVPKVNGRRPLPSSRSSSPAPKEPKTIRDVVSLVAGKHGIAMD